MKATVYWLILMGCFTSACTNSTHRFTFVVLPDTHYSGRYASPELFYAQTEWIADHQDSLSFAIHVGDITDDNLDPQWAIAYGALSKLDNKVPYALALGNHDTGENGFAKDRKTDLFNHWFPLAKYRDINSVGGVFEEEKLDNAYYLFKAGGMDWMVVSLEFGPRDEVLDWASGVVAQHPSHHVIVNTHGYLYSDSTLLTLKRAHHWTPQSYGIGKDSLSTANDGEAIWEKFVSQHENICMVFSGHVLNGGVGTLVSKGKHGNTVYQMLANYQTGVTGTVNGGNAFLRLISVDPEARQIHVKTYSPFADEFMTTPDQQFSFFDVDFLE